MKNKISISYQNESYEEERLSYSSAKLIKLTHYQLNKIINK